MPENENPPPSGDSLAEARAKRGEGVKKLAAALKKTDTKKFEMFAKNTGEDTEKMLETLKGLGSPFLVIEKITTMLKNLPDEGAHFCGGCGAPVTGRFFSITLPSPRRLCASCNEPDCRVVTMINCRMSGTSILFADRKQLQDALVEQIALTGGKLKPETDDEKEAFRSAALSLMIEGDQALAKLEEVHAKDLALTEKLIRERN